MHTMCLAFGPLSDDERKKVANGPIAFCNSDLDGDVLWGSLAPEGVLTVGKGEMENPSSAEKWNVYSDLIKIADRFCPGVSSAYSPVLSYGVMQAPANGMPVVGRLENCDVMGGWAGMGIVAGYTAAISYGRWIAHDNDDLLRIFEDIQPGRFKPHESYACSTSVGPAVRMAFPAPDLKVR